MCALQIVIGTQFSPLIDEFEKMNSQHAAKSSVIQDYKPHSSNYILPNTRWSMLRNELYHNKHHVEIERPSSSTREIVQNNDVQHLCISPKKIIVVKTYLCQSKDFKSFACIDREGNLGSCNMYFVYKKLHEPLCIKKNEFSFVVPCNNSRKKRFCFLDTSHMDVLIPCNGGSLGVCYRHFNFEYCKTLVKPRNLSHKRRSIQSEKIDPRNIHCKDCEVDILMEIYEGSTPIIEVKIRPLNGTLATNYS
ncbi:hypothetical protein JTE90_007286 [Oedothorax gibbosus]|uniref:Uncharacterized protein n=1 Tax=Oedothorax gibbosus TaxID=931172 RepID=A0AAV6VLF4_9ARAC|nr:hypothetical protein JTE90_007286 [Oedothorax gibbosus]